MAFPEVIINQTSKSSGKPLPGYDYYTGLSFYGTAPSVTGKWATFIGNVPDPNIKAQQFFGVGDIVLAGIIPFTDNTAAAATYLITAPATAAGETSILAVTAPRPNSTTELIALGTYTTVSGDTVIDTLGSNLVIFINAGTVTHGYSSSYNTGTNTLTLTAPKTEGICLNSGTPLSITNSGTVAGTITQFSGGTISNYAIWAYQISEYFAKDPNGNLWVGIISASSSFNEVKTLQKVAAGSKLRQIGVYDTSGTRGSAANISGTVLSLQNACEALHSKCPCIGIYSPNIFAVSDLSTYPDQNLNTAPLIQTIISQDGDSIGARLFVVSGQTIGNIGAKLGSISKSRVSASDAQIIPAFNMSDGVENNVAAFGNGLLSSAVAENLQIQLDNYRYTFFRKFTDTTVGTYWSDNKTCVISTSQYCDINSNRVAQKVERICYSSYLPLLNSEMYFNKDGSMKDYTIASFVETGEDAVTSNMITSYGQTPLISGVTVEIPDGQNFKKSGLIIDVEIDENGIARKITVNVGLN